MRKKKERAGERVGRAILLAEIYANPPAFVHANSVPSLKTEPKRRTLQGESWTAERPSPFPRSVGLHGGLDSTRSTPDHVCEEWGPDRAEPLGMVLDAEQPPVVSFQRFNDTVWCVA